LLNNLAVEEGRSVTNHLENLIVWNGEATEEGRLVVGKKATAKKVGRARFRKTPKKLGLGALNLLT
jgi:hypothetical protein